MKSKRLAPFDTVTIFCLCLHRSN